MFTFPSLIVILSSKRSKSQDYIIFLLPFYRARQLVVNFLSMCLSKKVFIFPSLQEDSLAGYIPLPIQVSDWQGDDSERTLTLGVRSSSSGRFSHHPPRRGMSVHPSSSASVAVPCKQAGGLPTSTNVILMLTVHGGIIALL